MAHTVLSLVIEKGPKAGHRIECKPSAVTTIGRARSNTVQINKDSGISQNHLRFKWTDGSSSKREDAGWIVEDPGSSNGTILNDCQMAAAKPVAIKSGDLIKIGAETTIRIDVLPSIPQAKSEVKARGTWRRKEAPSCAGTNSRKDNTENVEKEPEDAAKVPEIVVKEPENVGSKVRMNNSSAIPQAKSGLKARGNSRRKEAPLCADTKHHKENPEKVEKQPEKAGKQPVIAEKNPPNVGKDPENAEKDHENVWPKSSFGAAEGDKVDLNTTVEQWFHQMMEGGRNYIYRISESIIQDVTLESERFDESVRSM